MIGNKYKTNDSIDSMIGSGNVSIGFVGQFKNVLQDIVKSEIDKAGFPTYIAAIVQKLNEDGTVDVYLPPNKNNLVTNVLNKCGELLLVGDSVEIATKHGSLSNAWIALKHGTNVQGQAQEVKKMSSEVVMKVVGGRIVTTNLDRDATLGSAFTIVADDINLDGSNIVLNGKRGITIQSPYFNVTRDGYITATGGTIGGWSIGNTTLTGGNITLNSNGSITGGSTYTWSINTDGYATFNGITGNNATISGTITTSNITATGGTIGGWSIGNSTLSGGNITLNSNGSISGGSTYTWAIGTDGYTTFNGITGNNATISGTITTSNITATGGKIADYTINGAMLVGNNVGLSGTSGQGWAFWAGSNDAGSAPFRVGHDGQVHCTNFNATGGSISGSIISSGINASNITGGSLSMSRIKGGTLNVGANGGYLRVGINYTHPEVSGLNVGSGGIDCSAAGIRAYRFITEQGGKQYSGKDVAIQIYDGHGKVWYLSFQGGILYASEYK